MTNRKSHTPFRFVSKSTTLVDLERPIRTLLQKWCLSEPTTKIWMTIDPHYQQQKCRSMTTFWRYEVYADIRRGSLWRVPQTTVVMSTTAISAISLAISSETLERRPSLLYTNMQPDVSFSVIAKCKNLNDLEWLFRYFALNSVFMPVWLVDPTVRRSKNNCVKIKT